MNKLASRKFWICVAAFLGSIAASIAGIATNNEVVSTIGIICGVVSAAIYAAAEAYVDGASIKSNTTEYSETISVQSTKADADLSKAAATKLTGTTSETPVVQAPVVNTEEAKA